MNPLRIVFMGTPDIAVPTLAALLDSSHDVVGVFCQPDKPKGRGNKLQMPPTKELALAHNIPVYQPQSLRNEEAETLLKELAPDIVIVIAYGKILPPWLIHQPPLGCINLHASLLPKYRGAAPIQYAVWHDERETGMTIMHMDEGLDTGDILCMERIPVTEEDTSGTLFETLAKLGAQMIVPTVEAIQRGELSRIPQCHEEAVETGKITKEMGLLAFTEPAAKLAAKIRAFNPSPGCYTFLEGKRIKFWHAKVNHESMYNPEHLQGACGYPKEGTVVEVDKDSFSVFTGHGVLRVTEVQPENKKRMNAGDFARGHQLIKGVCFGDV